MGLTLSLGHLTHTEGTNIMRVTLGRGRNRRSFNIGPSKAEREQASEDVKNLVCRGGKLPFFILNGA